MTAEEEIKEIIRTQISNTERMNIFINMLAEQNEHMKLMHKREIFKIFGIAAEIFEDALLPFLNKILSVCHKRLNEPQLHSAISDSIGVTIHNVFKNIKISEENIEQFFSVLICLIGYINTGDHHIQVGAAMCLTRAIQNSPINTLSKIIPKFSANLLELLKSNTLKCSTQLLECLISLILAVESEFESYSSEFIQILKEFLSSSEWTTRKMSIDVLYTYATFLPKVIQPQAKLLLALIKTKRFDKVKQVREASSEAIKKIKELCSGEDDSSKTDIQAMKEAKSIFKGPANQNFFQNTKNNEEIQILLTKKEAKKENKITRNELPPNISKIEQISKNSSPKESLQEADDNIKQEKVDSNLEATNNFSNDMSKPLADSLGHERKVMNRNENEERNMSPGNFEELNEKVNLMGLVI